MIQAILYDDSSNLVNPSCLAGLDLERLNKIEKPGLYFVVKKSALHIEDHSVKPHLSYKVDFQRGRLAYRIKSRKKEDLLKAVGALDSEDWIVDATMGFAEDTIILSKSKAKVLAIDRNPYVCALVQDALYRLGDKAFTILCEDSIEWLKNTTKRPSIVYLDPMFGSVVKRRSKVKKEMQILQKMTSSTLDDRSLFDWAFKRAQKKVIIKRPSQADYFEKQKADYSVEGGSVRFDVYRV